MKCAYCGKEARGTREHIISSAILDLFPECYITFDDARNAIHEADPMVKDVCAECNNNRISYIDSYAKEFISKYFVKKYKEDDVVEINADARVATRNGSRIKADGFYSYSAAGDSKHQIKVKDRKSALVRMSFQEMAYGIGGKRM